MLSFKKKSHFWDMILTLQVFTLVTRKPRKLTSGQRLEARRNLLSFLGFMQFIAKSIKDYSKIASPLTELGKEKIPWKWEFLE